MDELIERGFEDDHSKINKDLTDDQLEGLKLQIMLDDKSPQFIPRLARLVERQGDYKTAEIVRNFQATEFIDQKIMDSVLADILIKASNYTKGK